MHVRYSYLKDQFSNCEDLWRKLKKFVATGDFTLGKELYKFEKNFARLIGTKYAVGVNSGTDAIKLSLKLLNIKPGDEVITAANTFVATVGAINEIGAKPVFVDCDDTFCMNVEKIESLITKKTKAILPVHFSGYMCNMSKIKNISKKYKIPIIEDACQSILAEFKNKRAGTWGDTAAFSLHPLKNINVWSDGGVITTNNKLYYDKLKLLRNHGLINRDKVKFLAFNSRLDTFQAIVADWLLPDAKLIAKKRILNAKYLDKCLSEIKEIRIPFRPKNQKIVFHLYMIFAKKRDELYRFCLKNRIEAKIHYPTPIYKQQALKKIIKNKVFPVTDFHAKNLISFPCDQHLKKNQLDCIVKVVKSFYEKF
jgi:dTDP-4-amino-4,6-dideoxygalactose transaminase